MPVGDDDIIHTRTRTYTHTRDRAAARSFVYPSRRSRVNAPRAPTSPRLPSPGPLATFPPSRLTLRRPRRRILRWLPLAPHASPRRRRRFPPLPSPFSLECRLGPSSSLAVSLLSFPFRGALRKLCATFISHGDLPSLSLSLSLVSLRAVNICRLSRRSGLAISHVERRR